jgi:autotransporter-associated beta strand protein
VGCLGCAPSIDADRVRAEATYGGHIRPVTFFMVGVARLRARHVFGAAFFAAAGLFLAPPAVAQTVINVTDGPSLSAAIAQADSNASASYVINFQNNITLSNAASNTLNAFNTTSNVTVNGNGFTLDGGSAQRGFFVFSGTVAIENLTVQNAQALGGSGGSGGGPVGGGGGGLGGALFVASSGIVTISNVTLLSNNASGGSAGVGRGVGAAGGGGGLGGAGGAAGGGGVGLGANGGGGAQGNNGSAGIVVGASSGGGSVGLVGAGSGGANGGGGGNFGGGGGVGGGNGFALDGGNGGFGGGGGGTAGGAFAGGGGFGGGGGGGGVLGGGGGFGGGGGGGDSNFPGGAGGNGGFGGGNGTGSGAGGGGGGLGGAVFVQSGGSLSIAGTLTINGNTVTPGNAQGGAGGGLAFGSGIFFQGTNGTPAALTFGAGTQSVGDVIADYVGSGGTNPGGGSNAADHGGSLALAKNGAGVLTLSGLNTFTGGTTVSGAGLVNFSAANNFGSGAITLNGGGLQWASGNSTDISGRLAAIGANGATFDTNGNAVTFATGLSGQGGLTKAGAGTLTLLAANSYLGGTAVSAGALQAGAANVFAPTSGFMVASGATLDLHGFNQTIGSLAGAGSVTLGSATLTTGNNNAYATFSGSIGGTGGLIKTGIGALTLLGTNNYSGATTISAGTLEVDGSIANSSSVTVNARAVLSGTGVVDPATTTIMSGGALMPGNAGNPTGMLSITGNLAFQSGALYLVQLTPAASALTAVTGSATLNGTVSAAFLSGSYVAKQYTILTAAGGVSGSFNALDVLGLPSGFKASLSYDANDAFLNLNLAASFGVPGGLNVNQQNVANALTNFFNTTGSIPAVFGALTPTALTQASGELATGSQQATFDAMNLFMGVLTDPFVAGRGDDVAASAAAAPFADEGDGASAYAAKDKPRSKGERDAYAAVYAKAPVVPFEQRWSVWAAGFGGSQTTDGNAALGSNSATSSSVYGTAVGADYRFSPFTMAGFALAGGGTSFSLANGLGSGRSDLFQAGAYVRHTVGPAYVTAALAYGWQDVTTDRTATIAGVDRLHAEFNANAFSGRLEGGYRFATPWLGFTPYAAAQFTTFDLPAYAESVLSGASTFALAYGAKDTTDTRSELGIRTDKSIALPNAILTLRGRLAWAHDFDPDRTIAATFQALPGASFVVNGAAQAHDSALTTASAELKWTNGWSTAATFEGAFSEITRSYAGKGVLRYAW